MQVLLGLLDWRAGGTTGLCAQMKWNESEASVGRVLAIEVLVSHDFYLSYVEIFLSFILSYKIDFKLELWKVIFLKKLFLDANCYLSLI